MVYGVNCQRGRRNIARALRLPLVRGPFITFSAPASAPLSPRRVRSMTTASVWLPARDTEAACGGNRLRLAELAEHGVDGIECGLDLFSDLGGRGRSTVSERLSRRVRRERTADRRTHHTRRTYNYLCAREHDLARDEDEEHNLRLDHTIDEAGEQLRVHD